MRWIFVLLGVAGAALVAALVLVLRAGPSESIVLPQSAMPGRLLVGFQDDPSFRWAPDRAGMLDRARDSSASILRTVVVWRDAAPNRPANPADPFDPAYQLDDVDDLVRSAQQRGMELLITIWGTPEWANGGQTPNRPPHDPAALEHFATALADRYSGRHSGYPAVRLFSAWNEPNLEQFLAPQFDEAGTSVGPALYAPIARAVYDGVKRGNPEALVAIGETSPRGHDIPTNGRVQDSHSPARFARLLAEAQPAVRFDAWAQHPYPPRSRIAPDEPVRWPRVGIGNLERFGTALDEWFGRDGHADLDHGVRARDTPTGAARHRSHSAGAVRRGSSAARGRESTRSHVRVVRVPRSSWTACGRAASCGRTRRRSRRSRASPRLLDELDGRHPVLPEGAEVARVPGSGARVLRPCRHAGRRDRRRRPEARRSPGAGRLARSALGRLAARDALDVRVTDPHGHSVLRTVRIGGPETIEVD